MSNRPRFASRSRLLIALIATMFGLSVIAYQMYDARSAYAATAVFINEIHYDNAGTDAGEFIEVAGPAGTSLTGYSIVLYNGAGGASYDTDALSGVIPNQQGGFGTVSLGYPSNGIQNGSPDGVALVGPGSVLIQFLCYEGTFAAVGGPAAGQTCTDIGVSQAGADPIGNSLFLIGSGTTYEDFTWSGPGDDSPGAVNNGQTFAVGDLAPTVTATSPVNGATNVAANSDIIISFSESVNATGSSFLIECPLASSQTFTLSSSPSSSFTLNPTADLPFNTTCQVTTFASGITDADTNDPPDNMVGNHVFTFTTAGPPPPVAEDVIINELDSDQVGTDAMEFVELFDGGVGNTSLTGLVVVFYNGATDTSYASFDLDGFTTDANGYLTIGNAGVPGVDITFGGNSLQNGQDAVAIYAANGSDFPNGTAVSTANLQDALVYDNGQADDPGLLVLLNAGEPQINEAGAGSGVTHSIGRCPNGSGGHRNTSSYLARTPTPGADNNCPPPPEARTIMEIQGSGMFSPYDGVTIVTTGIVTGRKGNGFFLQDAAGDGDSNTSDGVFVFTSSNPTVAVGDAVQVTGIVSEFESSSTDEPDGVAPPDPKTITEITGPTVVVNSSGNPLPAAVNATGLGVFSPSATSRGAQLERYESMRMTVASIVVSQPTNDFAEFWGVEPPRPRPFREPGIEAGDPIPAADDGPYSGFPPPSPPNFDGNFERVLVDSDDQIVTFTPFTRRPSIQVSTGAVVSGITGPLDYAFDSYRIALDANATPLVTPGISAAIPVPVPTSDEFTIAHANLENFGVSNSNFADRLNKASNAVRNVLRTPDVLGVIEVFDLPSLQQLATKINTDAASPGVNYVAYLEESASTFSDSQDVGYLVNTARVTVVGTPVQYHRDTTFTYLSESPDLLHDRPAFILTVDVPQVGTPDLLRVKVVLNHTKSLIAVDSPRPRGGGGTEGARNREKRRLQAEDIADLIETLQNENLVVLGDLNAFEFNDGLTDVVGTLRGVPVPPEEVVEPSVPDRWSFELTNLLTKVSADQRYSFTFEGNAQVLDHILVNDNMLARNNRLAYARYNADFAEAFAADASRPERLSDHDAPVAAFTAVPSADLSITKGDSPDPVETGTNITYTINVTNNGLDTAHDVVVTDNLPSETTFVSCSSTDGGVCGGTGNNRTVTFSSLPNGESATITLVATVNCDVANNTVITNEASVDATTGDPDTGNNSQSTTSTASNPAPVITDVSVDKPVLGPPNHKMVDVTVNYSATDNCGSPTCVLTVSSNEPVNGVDDGNTAPDWEIVDDHHVRLRAERSGTGTGRVYTITITCTDSGGRVSTETVTVTVPLN